MQTEVAKILLEIQAVHLNPDNFFTWTSGIKSPIYCDNRQIISYPQHRKRIVEYFVEVIKNQYPETQIVAGTSTAGIPWAAWIAQEMNLPMLYIRSSSKGHGLKNAIEGKVQEGKHVIVIEDLISTGGSSIQAAMEIIRNNMKLEGVISIFNYAFPFAKKAFETADIPFTSLSNLEAMLDFAQTQNLLSNEQIEKILKWKNSTSLN